MQCTIDTSPHGLAGVTFHDVTGGERTRLASVELVSRKCYSGQTLASCSFDDSKSSLTLKAAVTDLRVGERRRYECTVHYGTKTEKYQVNVTVDATATTSLSPLPSTEGNTEALAATTSDPLPSARPDYVHKTEAGAVTVDGISVGIGCGVMVALLALIALFVFVCRNRRKSFEGIGRRFGLHALARFCLKHVDAIRMRSFKRLNLDTAASVAEKLRGSNPSHCRSNRPYFLILSFQGTEMWIFRCI
ncbi:hypothetical protein BaRGS_00013625, partial [Batillaria attramentaria]